MLSIGQFSKACHVTIKTLHHYDKLQLLKPAYIDPQSGFRYYKSSQIETMMQIQKYKRYGFSLEQIQHLLALQPMQRKSFFEQKKMELIHQKDELELVIQDLKVIISKLERTNMNENTILETNHVDLVEFPYTYIYSVRDTMGVGDFGRYFSKIFEELKEKNVTKFGLTGSRYFDEAFDPMQNDTEVFVIMDKNTANHSIEKSLCAHMLHKGSYSSLSESYAAIVKWMEENGYESTGAPFELYTKCGFNGYPLAQWETDIYFPIKKKNS